MAKAIKNHRQPFANHIDELRARVMWCVSVLVLACLFGYGIRDKLLHFIRAPIKSQLYYTSPIGGFNALLYVSVLFGIIVSLPFWAYHAIRFITPVLEGRSKQNVPIGRLIFLSLGLAAAGIAFAYYVCLPYSLHYLTNVGNHNLMPFITINEYLHFALTYLVCFGVLFQLPLVLLFINRIRPLKPSSMMRLERYVIAGVSIITAVLTPDPLSMAIMALPLLLLYQVSIIWVWLINRHREAFRSAPIKAAFEERFNLPNPFMQSDFGITNMPATTSNAQADKPARMRQRRSPSGHIIMDIQPA